MPLEEPDDAGVMHGRALAGATGRQSIALYLALYLQRDSRFEETANFVF